MCFFLYIYFFYCFFIFFCLFQYTFSGFHHTSVHFHKDINYKHQLLFEHSLNCRYHNQLDLCKFNMLRGIPVKAKRIKLSKKKRVRHRIMLSNHSKSLQGMCICIWNDQKGNNYLLINFEPSLIDCIKSWWFEGF